MSLPLLTVDQVLTTVTGNPSEADLQAYVLSMVFANATGRAARNDAPDPAAKVQAFNAQWNSQLGNLGWVITAAGTSSIQSASSDQTSTVDHQIRAQAGSPAVAATLDALAVKATDKSPMAQALTQMFWEAGSAAVPFSAAVGQLSSGADGLTVELATFTLALDVLAVPKRGIVFGHSTKLNPTSVVGLFEQVLASSVELSVSHVTARLQPEVFAGNRSDLIEKLQGHAPSHFCSVPAGLVQGIE